MKLKIEKSATIITPTIGTTFLFDCIESVQNQTYSNLKHLLVIDGPEYNDQVNSVSQGMTGDRIIIQKTTTPENTGSNGFYGHRIYAGYPHLINSEYILFLDEDNWLEPNHVETLIDLVEKNNYDWAYSLRNICTKDKQFVDTDCCESIGRWPIFWSTEERSDNLVDTSSYCFRREFLIKVCQHWHSGWGGDRRFYNILTKIIKHDNYHTTGLHTLNYRLDDNMEKKYGSIDFFKNGNNVILEKYGEYPWKKT